MIEKNNGAYYKNKIMIVQLNILNVIYIVPSLSWNTVS